MTSWPNRLRSATGCEEGACFAGALETAIDSDSEAAIAAASAVARAPGFMKLPGTPCPDTGENIVPRQGATRNERPGMWAMGGYSGTFAGQVVTVRVGDQPLGWFGAVDLLRPRLEMVGATRHHLHRQAALTEDSRPRRGVVLPGRPGGAGADPVADVELIAGSRCRRARQSPADRERQPGGGGGEYGADLDHAVHAAARRAVQGAVVVVGARRGPDGEVEIPRGAARVEERGVLADVVREAGEGCRSPR